jgi:hypothetical protein
MSDDRPAPEPQDAAPEPLRGPQTIEPAERRNRRAADAEPDRPRAEDSPERVFSTGRGDVPEALKRRYFSEDGRLAMAFFAGPGAKVAAFHDHGAKLTTHDVNPATIRDMVAIAAHRGWSTIQVRGDDDFRREVWMEARLAGLEVRGYRARERDQQELEARREAEARRTIAPVRNEPMPEGKTRPPREAGEERLATAAFDAGVRGTLLEAGEAPYRRRQGQPVTPYIRLDRGDGRPLDVWGVGLRDALAKSGARVGDQVLVRRDGVDRVQKSIEVRDPRTGAVNRQDREVPRNRWVIVAERLRQASPAEAARDPQLRDVQSHLAVVRTVVQSVLKDPAAQARALAAAKDHAAARLAEGRQFRSVRVQQTIRAAERVEPPLMRVPERGRRIDEGPERTRGR